MVINSSTLRHLWAVIEETQTSTLLKLNDTDLVKQLISQLVHQKPLTQDETSVVSTYLLSKTTLIRAIAYSRRCG